MARGRQEKYVYGVVPGNAPAPSGTGIGRRRLRMVTSDGVGAVVSDVDAGEVLARREDLMAHARVLEHVLGRGVVLPMRFGVVMPDELAVRQQLLEPHRDDLLIQLQDLEGRAEFHLRALYREDALMREIVELNPEIAKLSAVVRGKPSDAVYYERIDLGQKVAEAVERTAATDAAALLDALEPLAAAVEVGQADHEHTAANLAFLVDKDQVSSFDAAVDDLGRQNEGRLTFKYTGPLPAYSFVELPQQV